MDNRSVQATSYNHWDTLSDKDSVSLQVSRWGEVGGVRLVALICCITLAGHSPVRQ